MADPKKDPPLVIKVDHAELQEVAGRWSVILAALVEKSRVPQQDVDVEFSVNFEVVGPARTDASGYARLTLSDLPVRPNKIRARILPSGVAHEATIPMLSRSADDDRPDKIDGTPIGSNGRYSYPFWLTNAAGRPVQKTFVIVGGTKGEILAEGTTDSNGMPIQVPQIVFDDPEMEIALFVAGFRVKTHILEGPTPEVATPTDERIIATRRNNWRWAATWILIFLTFSYLYNSVGFLPRHREERTVSMFRSDTIYNEHRMPTDEEVTDFLQKKQEENDREQLRDAKRWRWWGLWSLLLAFGIGYTPIAWREETLYKFYRLIRRRRYARRYDREDLPDPVIPMASGGAAATAVVAAQQAGGWIGRFFGGLMRDAPREVVWELLERGIMSLIMRGRAS